MIHKAKWRPDFVGSYDGEAEEAGRAEVYMTSHEMRKNREKRERKKRGSRVNDMPREISI